jgi:chromosome segregation ATPase
MMSKGPSSPTSQATTDSFRDVESNLSHTKDLLQSYSRISSSSSRSADVEETRAELRSTLEALEADLEDLNESVRAVEEAGSRWGMDEQEVKRRRGFVERVKREVKVCLCPGQYR